MCTYTTELIEVKGSAKGPHGWFDVASASIYVDHPVHLARGHAVLIDVLNIDLGASSRVALELDATSARMLAAAITRALDSVPHGLLDD